jgi:hypothetical protein
VSRGNRLKAAAIAITGSKHRGSFGEDRILAFPLASVVGVYAWNRLASYEAGRSGREPMKITNGQLLSAGDVANFLACQQLTQLDNRPHPPRGSSCDKGGHPSRPR